MKDYWFNFRYSDNKKSYILPWYDMIHYRDTLLIKYRTLHIINKCLHIQGFLSVHSCTHAGFWKWFLDVIWVLSKWMCHATHVCTSLKWFQKSCSDGWYNIWSHKTEKIIGSCPNGWVCTPRVVSEFCPNRYVTSLKWYTGRFLSIYIRVFTPKRVPEFCEDGRGSTWHYTSYFKVSNLKHIHFFFLYF